MHDDKDDDLEKPTDLSDETLSDVHGGGKRSIGSLSRMTGNDTIVGVNNDTLFAGSGDDGKSFNIGMPKKR